MSDASTQNDAEQESVADSRLANSPEEQEPEEEEEHDDLSETAAPDDTASDSEHASTGSESMPMDESAAPTREELNELVTDLRAEVTRLKVERAKTETQTWMQRNPGLAALLSVGLGVAAGYGLARWTAPQPPERLSDRTRKALQDLAGRAQKAAADVSVDLEDRAARAGEGAREIGRRLFEDAERAGAAAGERARDWGREAARRAQELSTETSERAQQVQEEGSKRARELGEQIAGDVERAEEELERRARETADTVRSSVPSASASLTSSVVSVLALAAGSFVAKKLKDRLA